MTKIYISKVMKNLYRIYFFFCVPLRRQRLFQLPDLIMMKVSVNNMQESLASHPTLVHSKLISLYNSIKLLYNNCLTT